MEKSKSPPHNFGADIKALVTSHGFIACIGGFLISVTGPVFLVSWRRSFSTFVHLIDNTAAADQRVTFVTGLMTLIDLEVTALMGCSLFGLPIAVALYQLQRNHTKRHSDLVAFTRFGVLAGALFSLFNLPAWLVVFLLEHPNDGMRFFLASILFLVAGATAGLWISWQAWRYHHPEAPLLPRYSLKTLLAVIFAWGLLLAIFQPA